MVLKIFTWKCKISKFQDSESCYKTTKQFHVKGCFFFVVLFFSGHGFTVALELALCRPGWPRTHRYPPAPASATQVLGLKLCAIARLKGNFLFFFF